MGSYCYLINKEKRIKAEAYKYSGGGKQVLRIEQPKKLVGFLEHCREHKLSIECVCESYFDDLNEPPFVDF